MSSRKLRFHKLTMQNFLSYGNNGATLNLDSPGTTQIQGRNLDNVEQGVGANGVGKAQPLTSKILTPSGWVSMGDIKIHDDVIAADGTVSKVIGVFPQGIKDVYEFTFDDGRKCQSSGEHLWKIHSHRWRKDYKTNISKIITTNEIIPLFNHFKSRKTNQPYYALNIPFCEPIQYSHTDLPLDPYTLGALLGDGCLTQRNIQFSNSDSSVIERVSNGLPINQQMVTYDNSINYHIFSNGDRVNTLANILKELNLIGTYSDTKFIPDIYKYCSVAQRVELLQGLMDTDGTVEKTGNVNIRLTSKQMILDIQEIVRSLGGSATISNMYPKLKGVLKKPAYNLSIHLKNIECLFTVERKKQRILKVRQYENKLLKITNIQRVEDQECQCIMIDHPDHLYITDDYVVTHNTTAVNAIVYALYGEPLSDIKLDDIVNDINKKECVVSITFTLDDDFYEITRYRKMKTGPEGNYVNIFKNNKCNPEDNLAKATIPETNIWIEQLLDMPKDLFTRLVVFDADESSFFNLPAAKQRDIMENLFQLTILSQKAESLKEQQKDTKGKLAVEEVTIESLTKQIETYKNQISREKERVAQWDTTHNGKIGEYRDNIVMLDAIDFEHERKLFKQIADIELQISQLDLNKIELSNKADRKVSELDAFKLAIKTQINELQSQFKLKQQTLQTELLQIQNEVQDEKSRLQQQFNLTKSLDNDLKTLDTLIETNISKINKLKVEIDNHNKQIEILHKNECPECGQQVPDATANIEKRNQLIEKTNSEIQKLLSKNDECDDAKAQISGEREQLILQYKKSELDSKQPVLIEKIECIKHEIQSIELQQSDAIAQLKASKTADIEIFEQQIKSIEVEMDDLYSQKRELLLSKPTPQISDETRLTKLEAQKTSLRKQLDDLEATVNPHLQSMEELLQQKPDDVEYTNINQLKKMIDHQLFLIKALTDKKSFIRKKLISKRLPYLNERLTHYLKNMGLPYQVTFNSDLTPSIAKRGTEKSFGNLSHGQKARVNFALSFAFRDVLERMHRSVNICLLDEVLDKALCSVGANAAVSLINEKAREDNISIFVITHKSELSTRFNKHITVVLEKGFSTIEVVD